MNDWRTDGGKDGARDDLHRYTNGRTAEGAHLLFGLFLVAADLQVILQHSARRQRDTCYCGPDPPVCLYQVGYAESRSIIPFEGTFLGKRINYTAKAALVHVGE